MVIVTRDTAAIAEARAAQLESVRVAAIARINAEVGRVREKYITDLPGQDAIYQAKEAEAARYLAEAPETLDGYPFMAAEVGILAPTAADVAAIWIGMGAHWRTVAAAMEGLRMAATNAVNASDSPAEVEGHVAGFLSQMEAF